MSLNELGKLAREVLPRMWNPTTRLFSHKTRVGPDRSYVNERSNPLYSAMALVGLLEDEAAGGEPAPPLVGTTLDALHSIHAVRPEAALGGCLMWAGALAGDRRADDVLARATRVLAPRRASSMDLGLLLAGLLKVHEHDRRSSSEAAAAIPPVRDELLRRFCRPANLFRNVSRSEPAGIRAGNLTSFASQAYPIHGLAELARLEGSVRPECALAAQQIIDEQGPRGQWWWQYSRTSGRTIEGYPVYSVHQDGMAFMALGSLQNLGHATYDKPLWLGLKWLFGENELGQCLIGREPPIIYRCIQRRGSDPDANFGMARANRMRAALASVGLYRAAGTRAGPGTLEILHECRSYHLGWLLYARSIAGTW